MYQPADKLRDCGVKSTWTKEVFEHHLYDAILFRHIGTEMSEKPATTVLE
jgi:hypothetical protein